MKRNIICLSLNLLMMLILFISASVLTGCGDEESGRYRKLVLREGIAHFSFEYPENYRELKIDTHSEFTYVVYSRELLEEGWEDSWLSVAVRKARLRDLPDASAALEHEIQSQSNFYEDYQILERSSVSIVGVIGEQLIYSYTLIPIPDESNIKGLPNLLNRSIYFDHNGLIWVIKVLSVEEVAESDQAVWEHLLETFKILD